MEVSKTQDPTALLLGNSTASDPIRRAGNENSKRANWVDLDDLHALLVEGITNFAEHVIAVDRMTKQAGIMINDPRVNAMFTTITDDINRFTDEALIIRREHMSRTGYVTKPEDLQVYMVIYEKYRAALALLGGTTQQHTITLTEIAMEITDILKQREKGEEA